MTFRILVVEDDQLIRETVADILSSEGFDVLEAESGEEAMKFCGEHSADVIFTDIRLAGPLTGWDVAEHCRQANPDIPVIYATGYSHVRPRPVSGSILFQKPYRPDQILAAIHSFGEPARPAERRNMQRS
jgi:CheY-like chemotaxis protein